MRLYNGIGEIMTPKQEPSLFGLTNSNRNFKKKGNMGEKSIQFIFSNCFSLLYELKKIGTRLY